MLKDISPMHLQNILFISGATHITSHGGSTTGRKIPGIFKIRKLGDEHTVEYLQNFPKRGAMQGVTLAYSQKRVNRETTASNTIQLDTFCMLERNITALVYTNPRLLQLTRLQMWHLTLNLTPISLSNEH